MKYIAYYRVSTKKQGESGLGLDSQKRQVKQYVESQGGELISEYSEIESGKNDHRPALELAINKANKEGATLLIAKLDRLSRNASFVLNLRDSKVSFIALDCPNANTLTIGIFALLAQQERELISERTKKALNELKEKGVKLGKPENLTKEAQIKGSETNTKNSIENPINRQVFCLIKNYRTQGLSYQKIANLLNLNGFKTSTGKLFHKGSVYSLEKTMLGLRKG